VILSGCPPRNRRAGSRQNPAGQYGATPPSAPLPDRNTEIGPPPTRQPLLSPIGTDAYNSRGSQIGRRRAARRARRMRHRPFSASPTSLRPSRHISQSVPIGSFDARLTGALRLSQFRCPTTPRRSAGDRIDRDLSLSRKSAIGPPGRTRGDDMADGETVRCRRRARPSGISATSPPTP